MRQHHNSNVDMAIIALMRDSLLLPHEVAGARWEDLTPAEDGPRKLPIASSKDNPRAIVNISAATMDILSKMRTTNASGSSSGFQ